MGRKRVQKQENKEEDNDGEKANLPFNMPKILCRL